MLVDDPLTGGLRIVATERAKRLGPRPEGCPFCPGNEETTPAEIDRTGEADGGWSARAFPNLFPLVEEHEVLALSPRHVTSVRELDEQEWQHVLVLLARRLAGRDGDRYFHVFVNDGKPAGASLEHVHAQIVPLPRIAQVEQLTRGVRTGSCALCEPPDPKLGVWSGDGISVVAAQAPRTSGSLLVVPDRHLDTFDQLPTAVLSRALRVAFAVTEPGPLNAWFVQDSRREAHPYVEIVPRSAIPAGVEMATAIGVSLVSPQAAAASARERLNSLPWR